MLKLFWAHRWQQLSKGGRELVTQSAISFTIRIVGVAAGFFLNILIARQLGAEQAGYYFLGFTVINVLAVVGRVGLDQTMLRFTGVAMGQGQLGRVRDLLNKVVFLCSLTSLFLSIALWGGSGWLAGVIFNKPEMTAILQGFSPAIVGVALTSLVGMSLHGMRKTVPSTFIINVAGSVLMICALSLFHGDSAVEAGNYFTVISWLTLLIGGIFWLYYSVQGNGLITWKEIFSSCLPLWTVAFMGQIVQWSGQLIAGAWIGSAELAQLAVSQRTAMLVSIVLVSVNIVVAPRVASMYKKGEIKRIERLVLQSVRLMLLVTAPIILIMLIFPDVLMGLFGKDFRSSTHLLQILALGQFVNVATGSVGLLLTMSGHEKDMRTTMFISGIIALFLGFVIIPLYGVTGSAVATSLSIAAQNLIAAWFVNKRLGINMLAIWK